MISNMTPWAIRTGPGCSCMCVPWWNVATLGTHTNFYQYVQVHIKPQQQNCELGHGWHAQVGCMGKDSSPPLKMVGLWLTSWVSQWVHIPWPLGATTPMSCWHNHTHVAQWVNNVEPGCASPGAASPAAQWVGQNVDCRCSLSVRSTSETSVRSTADGFLRLCFLQKTHPSLELH